MVFPLLSLLVSLLLFQMQLTKCMHNLLKVLEKHYLSILLSSYYYYWQLLLLQLELFTFNKHCVKFQFNMQNVLLVTAQTGGQQTHLPLKVNAAGVIPVIFASAFLMAPQSLVLFFGQNSTTDFITRALDYTQPIGMIIYIALIVAFTYFYAFIQVNPENVADNLKKQGAYIPGIRPGINTQNYLTSVLYRLTFVGAIFLAVISIYAITIC